MSFASCEYSEPRLKGTATLTEPRRPTASRRVAPVLDALRLVRSPPQPHQLSLTPTDSSLAIFNSVQNFITTSLTRRIYNKSPGSGASRCARMEPKREQELTPTAVNYLQARTFAVWTLASAAIRIYAAYNINTKG